MNIKGQQATIFGGSGMVGRAIIERLSALGYTVKIATRTPQACYALKTSGTPGQIVPQLYDPARPDTIAAAIHGSSVVINCVGVLFEQGRSTFHAAHHELARQIATACKRYAVDRLVHISALGIDQSKSKYATSKRQGEEAVRDVFPNAVILRPSIIFGPDDSFFNRFARMITMMPFLPLIGGGKTKFQPVYIGDVASAVVTIVNGPTTLFAKTYELGGPDIVTFRDIYSILFAMTGRTRLLVSLPWGIAKIQGWILERLPGKLLTRDQVISLQTDTIVQTGALGFKELGLVPTAMATILPIYLSRFRPGGLFGEHARA
jgi:uncharacterized protein YbjT (DUF2867 family)